ncbi:MAG: hypothetical protein NTW75_02330, partial [Planctomycetales bacterium]|nr:hypothetical protein [Planctomycetales bacterium]
TIGLSQISNLLNRPQRRSKALRTTSHFYSHSPDCLQFGLWSFFADDCHLDASFGQEGRLDLSISIVTGVLARLSAVRSWRACSAAHASYRPHFR